MVSRLLGRLPWLDIMYQNQAEGEEENTYYRTSLRAHASPSTTFRGVGGLKNRHYTTTVC